MSEYSPLEFQDQERPVETHLATLHCPTSPQEWGQNQDVKMASGTRRTRSGYTGKRKPYLLAARAPQALDELRPRWCDKDVPGGHHCSLVVGSAVRIFS